MLALVAYEPIAADGFETEPSYSLRLPTSYTPAPAKPAAISRATAYRLDHSVESRLSPNVELTVQKLADDGLFATATRPLHPGERVAIQFPKTSILPAPTVHASVERCLRVGDGYALSLGFDAPSAA